MRMKVSEANYNIKGNLTRLTFHFLPKTMEARSQWGDILQATERKEEKTKQNCEPGILYLAYYPAK